MTRLGGIMNVLLDLDGTLTDPREGILGCIRYALARLGCPIPKDRLLERHIGPPLREAFRTMLPDNDGALIEIAVEIYRERFAEIGLFENRVYDGIPEALGGLVGRDVNLVVATSKPRIFAERILEHFGLGNYIRSVYGSELDGTRSDKRQLIQHVMVTERFHPTETVMVGDRQHDILGAIHNDVFPVGVLWGYGSEQELREAGARKLMSTPAELADVIT